MSPMLARHPLEPLDADEIRAASAILREAGHLRDRVRVIGLTLHEPTRDDLRRFAVGQALDRAVFAILLDTASGETEEVIVSLTAGRVASSKRLRDVHARARLLVTHNIRHFRSGQGVRVVRPRTLIEEARAWMSSLGDTRD